MTPLVGREEELGLLHRRWAQVLEGHGQVMLLSGEAGIGKSRLVREFQETVERDGAMRLTFRCSPYHQQSALYPMIEHLQRLVQVRQEDPPETQLARLEQARLEQALQRVGLSLPEGLPLLAALLSLPHPAGAPPLPRSPERQKQQTQAVLLAWLGAEAEQQPVLAVWEDLHWADPSTLEWLGLLLDQVPTMRLLTLVTCRPEFVPPWASRAALAQLTLTRLTRLQAEAMVRGVPGSQALSAEVIRQIVARTDGVPLFVEELTKAVLEASELAADADHPALTAPQALLVIPVTLHDALRARLDRLTEGKAVAQPGAVLGRTFAYALLQAVAPLDEGALGRGLTQLVQAEILPSGDSAAGHVYLQACPHRVRLPVVTPAYPTTGPPADGAGVGGAVSSPRRDAAGTPGAALYRRGRAEEAVGYWLRAGERSNGRSAYVEAVAHLTKGLEVLQALPDTPTRAQHELETQVALGQALEGTKGFAASDRGHALARARELCRQVGDTARLFAVLVGLSEFHVNRGELQTARELEEECLALAQRQQNPAYLMRAHYHLGSTLYWLGELLLARAHLEQDIALYTPQQDRSPTRHTLSGVPCLAYAGYTLWRLGYPDQALTRIHEVLTLAQELSHAFSLARALHYATWLHGLRREWSTAQAEAAWALSTEQGFTQWVRPGGRAVP